MDDESLTKVHVDLPHHWAVGGESLWARHLGGDRYQLENVPFYAYDLNFHDVVEARPLAPDQKPSVLRVVERSGHQTLRVFFSEAVPEPTRIERVRALAPLAVTFERCGERLFALDLEPAANVETVRAQLDLWEAEGVLDYETCEARVSGRFDEDADSDT